MNITIYRGTHEIGGTLIQLQASHSRLLLDAGYPLLLNGNPIDDSIAKLPIKELQDIGVVPKIEGLYEWDVPAFDAVIISHAHIDHYGLLKYIHPDIPVYMSAGTKCLIDISKVFKIIDNFDCNGKVFKMYEAFQIGEFTIKPYLMDHSAFDAAAFEISGESSTVIYSGDFRGHGRKSICLETFINHAKKEADLLLIEGTMLGRQDEKILTEQELEAVLIDEIGDSEQAVLFQTSSQNIDRIVSFYRAASRLKRTFIIDVYTANVLFELRQLGNNLPYPSDSYENIKVYYPFRLTQKIFNEIGEHYAKRFSAFHISKEKLMENQSNIIMMVRPSMMRDIEKCGMSKGLFIYSMWQGYRGSEYQKRFEEYLKQAGFELKSIHTSGHAAVSDIEKVIAGLVPKKLVPIHTMLPDSFKGISELTKVMKDGISFEV